MSDLVSRKAVIDLMWELLENSEYDGDKIIATIDDVEKLAGLECVEMNCIWIVNTHNKQKNGTKRKE